VVLSPIGHFLEEAEQTDIGKQENRFLIVLAEAY
jgi:hypothetical protein